MDSSILPNRPDVVAATSTARPTATPPRVSFSEVLSASASSVVRGADQAVTALPGAPLTAVALRGGASASMSLASTIASPHGQDRDRQHSH
jgi:hypothetical protein